jgi:mannose-6-phosphate isomerase-like protein (cupin superfamily)
MHSASTSYDRKEHDMTINDIGPDPQSFDLEQQTVENSNYRTVAWSGRYSQLTLMSVPEGADIGLEMHPETDQFLRLDAGRGRVQMGRTRDNLEFEQEVSDGWCILVPAGTWHNVTNIGNEPMQLYTIYAPAHHKPGQGTRDRGGGSCGPRRRARELVGPAGVCTRSTRLRSPR